VKPNKAMFTSKCMFVYFSILKCEESKSGSTYRISKEMNITSVLLPISKKDCNEIQGENCCFIYLLVNLSINGLL